MINGGIGKTKKIWKQGKEEGLGRICALNLNGPWKSLKGSAIQVMGMYRRSS